MTVSQAKPSQLLAYPFSHSFPLPYQAAHIYHLASRQRACRAACVCGERVAVVFSHVIIGRSDSPDFTSATGRGWRCLSAAAVRAGGFDLHNGALRGPSSTWFRAPARQFGRRPVTIAVRCARHRDINPTRHAMLTCVHAALVFRRRRDRRDGGRGLCSGHGTG